MIALTRRSAQRGYSLAEALVVLAIIGMISVVTIPQFLTFYRGAKLKTSLREFTSQVRSARGRAVTRSRPTKISFDLTGDRGSYRLYEGTVGGGGVITWAPVWPERKSLAENVVFYESVSLPTFADIDTTPDGLQDIVFLPNGTVQTPGDAYMRFDTDVNVPINQYKIAIGTTGVITPTGSRV